MKHDNRQNLEAALAKHLSAEAAPAELWERVQEGRSGARAAGVSPNIAWNGTGWMKRARLQWAAAAAVFAAAGVGAWMWHGRVQNQAMEELAVSALNQEQEQMSLVTGDASEVRSWVRRESGIDIPLPPKHSSMVQIVGARLTNARFAGSDQAVAEVSYQIGEYRAALLVTKDRTGVKTYPKHSNRPSDSFEAARISSWSMRGQSYTLASTAPSQSASACLLCHANEPPASAPPGVM